MPQEAEDLAEDMIFRFLDEQQRLIDQQKLMIANATQIQAMPKALLTSMGPAGIRRNMIGLQREVQNYYRSQFDNIYLAGARTVDPTFTIGTSQRAFLAKLNTNEYLKLRTAMENVVRDSRRFVQMVWNDRVDRRKRLGIKYSHVDFTRAKPLPEKLGALSPHNILNVLKGAGKGAQDNSERTIRLRGIKAVQYRPGFNQDLHKATGGLRGLHSTGKKYTLGDYGSMVTRTNANRAYNMGVVHAIQRKGIKYVNVSDGPECGWTYHEDGDLANGSVRTVEEAAAYPIAHPNCRRAFSPATPEQSRREDERRANKEKRSVRATQGAQRSTAVRALRAAALVGGGALAAAEATNLAEAGFSRFVASGYFDELLQRTAMRAFQGSLNARLWVERLSRIEDIFTPGERAVASVSQVYPGGPTQLPNLPLGDTIRYFADGTQEWFVNKTGMAQVPDKIRRALGAADDAIDEVLSDRFQAFYHAAKKAAMSEDVGENIRNVIDFEAKRRGLFLRTLDNLPGAPEVRASWSKWGPRIRVDVTDWVRTKVTATPTGLISSVGVNAAGQLRGVVKMYQDGLIGGHISALPRNFANGVFRAIVEIDERGQLVGNLRLVPGGPLRLRLEFKTKSFQEAKQAYADSTQALIRDLKRKGWFNDVKDAMEKMTTSPGYRGIRRQLLGQPIDDISALKHLDSPDLIQAKDINALKYALDRAPVSERTLYRGMTVTRQEAEALRVGETLDVRGFSSFTTDLEHASRFSRGVYQLPGEEPKKRVVVSLVGKHQELSRTAITGTTAEDEFLIGKNLRIIARTLDDDGTIFLRAIQDEWPAAKVVTRGEFTDLRDFAISPLGTIGNLAQQLRQFEFDRAVLEFRIFNKSALEISGNLRIPVGDIKTAIREGVRAKELIANGDQTFTGTLKYFFHNPDAVKKIFEDSKSTLFGNIRFANLTHQAVGDSNLLRTIGTLNVRLLTKAKLEAQGLQAIATNMRIHAWNIYDIANVLKITARDAQVLVRNGMARVSRFMEDLGVKRPEDLFPVWRQRVGDAQVVVRRSRKANAPDANMAETILHALRPFYYGGNPQQTNAYEIRALQTLAGLEKGMTSGQIYNKLRNMLTFLREQEWVEGNYVAGYADGINDYMLRLTSRELVTRIGMLRVV